MEQVLEGVDASRRAGWARAFAAEKQIEHLQYEFASSQETVERLSRRLRDLEEICTCSALARLEQRREDERIASLTRLGIDPSLSPPRAYREACARGFDPMSMSRFRPLWRRYQQETTPLDPAHPAQQP